MDADQQLFDVAIVAQKMGITPEAVRKRIARGSLQAVKQDGRWYVAASGASWANGDDRPVHAAPDDKGIATVAKKMGITPEALRKAIARGSIQVMKRGGRWYVATSGASGASGASGEPRTNGDVSPVHDAKDDNNGYVQVLLAQLMAKDRQISELHRLLAHSGPAPIKNGRPKWLRMLGWA